MDHDVLMRQAITLARRGRGRVEPNPRVGAIALRDGEIVGRGFHAFYGGDHAEVAALRDAEQAGAAPDTLVVTLEPCSSVQGCEGKKTPPCTEAILRANVASVVIGQLDPDPRHHEQGAAILRHGGVEVVSGVVETECAEVNRPFARWLQMEVPWVIAKWAMSLDGKTATHSGDSKWISGDDSRARVHEVRGEVDAVMIGLKTAVIDDPELTVRHVAGDNPTRIVVDPLAELPANSKLAQTARTTPTWAIVGAAASPDKISQLRDQGVTVVEVPGPTRGHDMDLAAGARELRRRGIRRILMEGGGGLAARLFDANLVHQVMVFLAPKVIGGERARTPVSGLGVDVIKDARQFGEIFHESIADDIIVHGFATPPRSP
jgi:diaminohydroxyphosphoribosylaminopyrimidine deaminase / 5-amino-6-(5-phosphoribosylamino)uracil reductase